MEFTLNKDEHCLVKTPQGNVLLDEAGNWLVTDSKANRIIAVPPSQKLFQFFNIIEMDDNDSPSDLPAAELGIPSCSSNPSPSNSAKWERQETLLLLELFKIYKVDVKSNKNDAAWKKISEELKENGFVYTPSQCETRFKYLKGRYVKKMDMGVKGTGEAPTFFDYFKEMNDIFGKKPNIVPVAIGSSLRGKEAPVSLSSLQEEPPHKKSRLEKEVAQLADVLLKSEEKRAEDQNRRHNKRLAKSDRALEIYQTMMQKLIDKL